MWGANRCKLPGAGIALMLVCQAFFGHAAERTWQGTGAGYNWNLPDNWVEGAVSANDILVFSGSVGLSNTNDFPASTRFGGIKFSSGAGSFCLLGNDVTLGGDITNGAATEQAINLGLVLDADRTICADAGPISIGGTISGGFGFTKTGTNLLTLAAAGSFTGSARINAGTVRLTHVNAVAGGSMVTLNGGRLQLCTDTTVSPIDLVMENSGVITLDRATPGPAIATNTFRDFYTSNPSLVTTLAVTNGANVTSGVSQVVFNRYWYQTTSTTIFDLGDNVELLTTAGPTPSMGHTINVIKNGPGRIIFAGNYGQWDGGSITINAGIVELRTIPGDTTQYRAPVIASAGAVLALRQDASYNFCSSLTLNGGMTTVLERATSGVGVTHTLSNLTFSGNYSYSVVAGSNMASGTAGLSLSGLCTVNGTATFNIVNGATAATLLTFTNMAGAGALAKTGSGTLLLNCPVSYTGVTAVSGGVLQVGAEGSLSNSIAWDVGSGAVLDLSPLGVATVPAGVMLDGVGTVSGAVAMASGSVLEPGGTGVIGTLTFNGDLALETGAVVNVECAANQVDTDVIRVNGNLVLPASVDVNVSSLGVGLPVMVKLFSYSGTCSQSNFAGWTVRPGGYTVRNYADRGEVVLVRHGLVIRIR